MDITISEQFAPYQKVDPVTNEKYITREDICKAINLPSLEFLDDLLERCKLEQTGKLGMCCLRYVCVVVYYYYYYFVVWYVHTYYKMSHLIQLFQRRS